MAKNRPVNLNLFTIRFPIPAVVSILHRLSGIVLFLSIPFVLWALAVSLTSEQDFDYLHQLFTSPLVKIILWILLAGFFYHFVAGIRHLLMDINIGVELKSGRSSAVITLAVVILLVLLTGIWLW